MHLIIGNLHRIQRIRPKATGVSQADRAVSLPPKKEQPRVTRGKINLRK